MSVFDGLAKTLNKKPKSKKKTRLRFLDGTKTEPINDNKNSFITIHALNILEFKDEIVQSMETIARCIMKCGYIVLYRTSNDIKSNIDKTFTYEYSLVNCKYCLSKIEKINNIG